MARKNNSNGLECLAVGFRVECQEAGSETWQHFRNCRSEKVIGTIQAECKVKERKYGMRFRVVV